MPLFTESVGTVFEPKFEAKSDAYVLKTLSISDGKDREGKAVYTSWNAHFVGKAKEPAKNLKEKTKVKFKAVVNKNYNKNTKKEYVYLAVYEFSTDLETKTVAKAPVVNEVRVENDINISDNDLPFM